MTTSIRTAARTVLRALGKESRLGLVSEDEIIATLNEIERISQDIDGGYVDQGLLDAVKGTSVGSLGGVVIVAGYGTDEINEILVGDSMDDVVSSISHDPSPDWVIAGNLHTGEIADCRPRWTPGTWTL